MTTTPELSPSLLDELRPHFGKWEVIGDLIDQSIDLMLNIRQSGHPGGSRSKVPFMVATTLGAGMRWDVRNPDSPFGDRYVLVAGHCNPGTYAMLAVYNEALRIMHERTATRSYASYTPRSVMLTWEDLLWLRHNGHLPGHAEMEGKTLFFKFNTGPSGSRRAGGAGRGHGPQARRRRTREGLRGRGRGRPHRRLPPRGEELGLRPRRRQPGLPARLERPRHRLLRQLRGRARRPPPTGSRPTAGASPAPRTATTTSRSPRAARHRARRGHRGPPRLRLVQDPQGPRLRRLRRRLARQVPRPQLGDVLGLPRGVREQVRRDLRGPRRHDRHRRGRLPRAVEVLVPDRLQRAARHRGARRSTWPTPSSASASRSPRSPRGSASTPTGTCTRTAAGSTSCRPELFLAPGAKAANKDGFAKFGAWVNSLAKERMGRPLVLAAPPTSRTPPPSPASPRTSGTSRTSAGTSARNTQGALLPQQITEFTNAGLVVGAATVNMSDAPRSSSWATGARARPTAASAT